MSESQPSFRKLAWQLTRPYWVSEERWGARLLLAAVVGLTLGGVYIDVQINHWYNDFYNTFQAYDQAAFVQLLIRFSYLAAIGIIMSVYVMYLGQMLRIKWRRWLTERYLGNWLGKQNYYRIQLFGSVTDNPDQRIAEDIDQFIRLALDLSQGALSSVVTLFSFLAILWNLSGPLDFALLGTKIHIGGYMVWVAFGYALVGTWITFRIGRPLIGLNYDQQRYEANFRYSLVRLRENSESVAFYKGEVEEQKGFLGRFGSIVDNWWQIMKRQKKVNWFTYGYGQIAVIFPFVVAAPRYFAKQMQLGGLMQTASAFGKVQGALSYLVDAYTTIASWKAVTNRLSGFNESIHKAEVMQGLADAHATTDQKAIEANGLTIRLPDESVLLENVSLAVKPRDALLITGRSGAGKSTLLRALAGLWPFVEGTLSLPDARMLFVPQKPYLPLGTLAQALSYPNALEADEAKMREVLHLVQLERLAGRLTQTEQWSHVLSPGEQQRVAFARILLARPDFVFLDEATSALDEATEAHLYGVIKTRLPEVGLVSVGHRETLRAWHTLEMALDGKS